MPETVLGALAMGLGKSAALALSKAVAMGTALVGKLDGWQSTVTGVGLAASDKSQTYTFARPPLLTTRQCSDLYHFDDLANTIVSAVPEDSTREGIQVIRQIEQGPETKDIEVSQAQEESQQVQARLVELDALGATKEAMIWARAMGGAGVLGTFDGTGLPNELLVEDRITRVLKLECIDREDVSPCTYYREGPKTGQVETYFLNIVESNGAIARTTVIVHESRIVWFKGASTSRKERRYNGGWDHSVLQRLYNILMQVNSAWGAVMAMMQDMSQAVLKMDGLIDAMASEESDGSMEARVRFMNLVRSVSNMLVLDAKSESFEVVERASVTGAETLVDRLFIRLSAAARMPVTRLMGQSPAGLNATGASDIRWWYDTIRVCQTLEIRPRYLTLVRWVCQELSLEVTGWELKFPPLWQMSPTEEAALRASVAATDKVYIDAGVVLPEEITLARWGSGAYSPETSVNIEVRKATLAAMANADKVEEPVDLGTVGAQTTALLSVIQAVINKTIPRESGLAVLMSRFGMLEDEAERTLGPESFAKEPEAKPATPPPGFPPKAGEPKPGTPKPDPKPGEEDKPDGS